jgi:hypothetical protein
MKPNLQGMNRQELRAYVSMISVETDWVTCPALSSPDDLDQYPAFLEKVQREHPWQP